MNHWHVVLFGKWIDVGAMAAFIIWQANFPKCIRGMMPYLPEANCTRTDHATGLVQVPDAYITCTIHMEMKVFGIVGPPQPQQAQQCYNEERKLPLHREVDKNVRLECETCRKPI